MEMICMACSLPLPELSPSALRAAAKNEGNMLTKAMRRKLQRLPDLNAAHTPVAMKY